MNKGNSLHDQEKRVCILGMPERCIDIPFRSTEDLLKDVGANTGNLAFHNAIIGHIANKKGYYHSIRSVERIKEEFDILVLPAANHLSEKVDLGWLVPLLERSKLPLVILGLGAQAPSSKHEVNVPAGTRRLLDLLGEQSSTICVRGEFTKYVLERLGYSNTAVTGCPSNFLNPRRDLGRLVEDRYKALVNVRRLALNLEYFSTDRDRVPTMMQWLNKRRGALVLQSSTELFSMIRGDCEDVKPGFIKWAAKFFFGNEYAGDFVQFLRSNGRVFFELGSWMDYLRTFDLSVGTRLHGNMLAFQIGTPAIFFPHDSRTEELCEVMRLPTVPLSKIEPGISLKAILDFAADFSGSEYDHNRAILAARYVGVLEQAGIKVTTDIRDLAFPRSEAAEPAQAQG